jgi:hypothetical protein
MPRDFVDRIGVVAFQRGELAALNGALEEADVSVRAEVVLAAPVVGHDVSGARLLGADDPEAVGALLGAAHPGHDAAPAAARHLVPGPLQRPGHERRAPRVARRDARRSEILIDLLTCVDAGLVHALLGLGDAQRRRTERAAAPTGRSGRRRIHHRTRGRPTARHGGVDRSGGHRRGRRTLEQPLGL